MQPVADFFVDPLGHDSQLGGGRTRRDHSAGKVDRLSGRDVRLDPLLGRRPGVRPAVVQIEADAIDQHRDPDDHGQRRGDEPPRRRARRQLAVQFDHGKSCIDQHDGYQRKHVTCVDVVRVFGGQQEGRVDQRED